MDSAAFMHEVSRISGSRSDALNLNVDDLAVSAGGLLTIIFYVM
jgi:hypothetical protein